jgi:hypothetical protein
MTAALSPKASGKLAKHCRAMRLFGGLGLGDLHGGDLLTRPLSGR